MGSYCHHSLDHEHRHVAALFAIGGDIGLHPSATALLADSFPYAALLRGPDTTRENVADAPIVALKNRGRFGEVRFGPCLVDCDWHERGACLRKYFLRLRRKRNEDNILHSRSDARYWLIDRSAIVKGGVEGKSDYARSG